jgi:hypothetical protein
VAGVNQQSHHLPRLGGMFPCVHYRFIACSSGWRAIPCMHFKPYLIVNHGYGLG